MGIAVGFCLTVPKQTATAAIYVEDIKNIAENAKTAINTYTNAINTAKQVSLMIPRPPAGAPRNRNPQATPCGSRLRQE